MTNMQSEYVSTACVPTHNAGRYLQQLAKHWSHNMQVEFDAKDAKVTFPRNARGADWPADGVFTMHAESKTLHCRIVASSEDQMSGLKNAVERHIDRFAFREAPLAFDWQDG